MPAHPELYSRSELRRQTGRYRSTIPARIRDWAPPLPSDLGADIEDATRALTDFNQYTLHRLGAEASAIGPMSAILLRTEGASSSQIENLTVSAKQLAMAEIGAGDSPNSRTVIGNVRALEAAVALSDDLSIDTILAMHRELLRHQSGMEAHAGRLREELVWIGRGSAGPLLADFVAPQHEQVTAALEDLLVFASRADLPALLQIAVSHAQFETIHPFVDGNGRTGRALVQSLLRSTGLAAHTTVPLSAGLLRDIDGYFASLNAFRLGDAAPIVRSFAGAARYAGATGKRLVTALDQQLADAHTLLTGVRKHSAARRLLPQLIAQPIVNTEYVTQTLAIDAATAHRALQTLTERGVLIERTGKRRGRAWQHSGILEVLDEYAESIRRR